jgi:hypothetical protein
MTWHNGLHIQAPQVGGSYPPVRAVADGEVVFVHAPTTPNTDVTLALNYNPFNNGTPTPAWTSDGFVVIRHTTEIGATGTTPTEVTYFSAYMHLSRLANCPTRNAPWKAGDAIYRKDELGAPGQIYGDGGQIHFEICCNEANLRQFVPRAPAWVDPLAPTAPIANGRTDSVFGSMYVYLPTGTLTSTTPPAHHLHVASGVGGTALQQPQWVQITYDMGSATLSSYATSGEPIGTNCHMPDFEYNLYAKATERHNSLDAATQALSSPSGWYELLRFGRNLGPDPLPAHAAHWREIPTATGTVWADLNAPGTFKLSDADFPAFRGWNCFDDDLSPTDQRCDSLHLKTLIRNPDPTDDRRMERAQLARRRGEPEVRAKLRRAICRFPSEWDQRTVVERYSWLLTEDFKPESAGATRALSKDVELPPLRIEIPPWLGRSQQLHLEVHPNGKVSATRKIHLNGRLRKREPLSPKRHGTSAALEIPMRGPTSTCTTGWSPSGGISTKGGASSALPLKLPSMPSACPTRPGPAHSRRRSSSPRRACMRAMPIVGSIARISTPAPWPASRQTTFRHQWMP